MTLVENKGGKLGVRHLIVSCVAVSVVAMVGIGAIVGRIEAAGVSSGEATANDVPAIQVTAKALTTAYASNPAAAQLRYAHRPLDVTGTAMALIPGFPDKQFLVLQGTNKILGPEAELTDASQAKAASLIKGTQVRLHCSSVSRRLDTPILDHCQILS